MPWVFLWIGAGIVGPEFLWWFLISRPRQRRMAKIQARTARFWRIRDMEMDIYGRWLS